ncbi:MAG: family lipase [Chitinophagaceae bacterium]|nr:family lipase [Chitinophagaceae bacterium]
MVIKNILSSFCFNYFKFIVVICISFISCDSTKTNNSSSNILPAASLQPYGRFIVNDKQEVELISSGVHFGFTFEGKQCEIFASISNANAHNYLQYELDGIYQKRIKISGNSKEPIIINAVDTGKHTIWIYKATEAYTGAILIQKISGEKISVLQKQSLPLIEFIGNSITCGAAADASEIACGAGEYHDQHNAYYAYGPRVARALGTEFILSSISGVGIYRNWHSDGPAMPEVYEKTDFQKNNTILWNFKAYTPQVVSIALGTNDFSNGDGLKKRDPFDSSIFVSSYIKFVQLVKSKYLHAQIALLSSPMLNGSNRVTLQNCLSTVKNKIDALYPGSKPVALYFFKPMQTRGCGGHPSVEDHAILAEELIPFFKKLL